MYLFYIYTRVMILLYFSLIILRYSSFSSQPHQEHTQTPQGLTQCITHLHGLFTRDIIQEKYLGCKGIEFLDQKDSISEKASRVLWGSREPMQTRRGKGNLESRSQEGPYQQNTVGLRLAQCTLGRAENQAQLVKSRRKLEAAETQQSGESFQAGKVAEI